MYTFLTINTSISNDIDINTFMLTNSTNERMDVKKSNQSESFDFDMLVSNNDSLIKDTVKSFSLKPKLDALNFKKYTEDIARFFEIESAYELFKNLTNPDVFIDIELYNRFPYKELTQLLCGMIMFSAQNDIEKRELTICVDDDSLEALGGLKIDFLISLYNRQDSSQHNILILPIWAHLAKLIKGMKC